MDDSHQGWANRETFTANVGLEQNKEHTFNLLRSIGVIRDKAPGAAEVKDKTWTEEQFTLFTLADLIRELYEQQAENLSDRVSFTGDKGYDPDDPDNYVVHFIEVALARVDWREIARYWITKYQDNLRAAEAAEAAAQ